MGGGAAPLTMYIIQEQTTFAEAARLQVLYELIGDGINTGNSTGTFDYSADGNNADISVVDSSFGAGNFSLLFIVADAGTYTATAEADPDSVQTGVFTELQ